MSRHLSIRVEVELPAPFDQLREPALKAVAAEIAARTARHIADTEHDVAKIIHAAGVVRARRTRGD